MFGSVSHLPELIIILILGLIILGPGKLPQVGGAVGKTIREFRRGAQEADEEAATKDGATKEPAAKEAGAAVGKKVAEFKAGVAEGEQEAAAKPAASAAPASPAAKVEE